MIPTASFALVPFHGHQVLAARVDEDIRIPMKRFCATIGLPWEPQRKRLQRDEILAEGASIMLVPSDGGDQHQITLPIELIPGFLFGADARRYAPELRERVRLFRAECYRTLHNHFFNGRRHLHDGGTFDRSRARRDMLAIYDRLKRATAPAERRFLYAMLEQDNGQFRLPLPDLHEIGAEAAQPAALIGDFFEALDALTGLGVRWDHARVPTFSACRPQEVDGLFQRHGIDMRIDNALKSASRVAGSGIEKKNVNSVIVDGAAHCWVFAPRPRQI